MFVIDVFLDLVVLKRTGWLLKEPLNFFEKNSKSTVIWVNTMVVVSFSASYLGIPCDWVESQGCRKVYQMQNLISSNFFFYLLHTAWSCQGHFPVCSENLTKRGVRSKCGLSVCLFSEELLCCRYLLKN